MEPIYEGLSKEKKQELLDRGYKEFEYFIPPKYCDPNEKECKLDYLII